VRAVFGLQAQDENRVQDEDMEAGGAAGLLGPEHFGPLSSWGAMQPLLSGPTSSDQPHS